ncbi:hypothetical protein HK405_001090, partial [Cladochytrium tenue]
MVALSRSPRQCRAMPTTSFSSAAAGPGRAVLASLVAAAACLLPSSPVLAQRGAPTVTVLNGTYEGYHLPDRNQDVFLGIPYAQPPVGSLRFREPQSLNFTWEDTKAATAGGLYSGGSANPSNNLTNFVYQSTLAGKPVLGVSLNYRLTAFGFLWGSKELTAKGSANNGLRDQRLALRWIQENIAYFGGDPSKVTIWGESSGALSVGKQLIAYGGRDDGLFRGAIMQSGGIVEKWPYNIANATAYTEDLYLNLTTTTGCIDEESPLE